MKYFIPILLLLTGCKIFQPTEWQSQKRINKVVHYHPYLLARYCAKEFPVISDTAFGTPKVNSRTDTSPAVIVPIDCDSIVKAYNEAHANMHDSTHANIADTSNLSNPKSFPVKCPPSTNTVKTIEVPVYITTENTAAIDSMRNILSATKSDRDKKTGTIKTLTWLSVILGALLIIGIVIGVLFWKFKIKNLVKN